VRINPISHEAVRDVGVPIDELDIHISVEDIALSIRKKLEPISVAEISKPKDVHISLREETDLAFYRGFEIQCHISRRDNVDEVKNVIWHKSQVLHQTSYVVKSSEDEALFEIHWRKFNDEDEKRDVFYVVDWGSNDVSGKVDFDCFQVQVNERLRDQFKRLEGNSHFGGMCIRMMAHQILTELLVRTLKFAQIDGDEGPLPDSLHDKFDRFLDKHGIKFNDLAERFQGEQGVDELTATSEVSRIFQKICKVGSTLEGVKFGGYR